MIKSKAKRGTIIRTVSLTLTCILLGIVISMQYRSVQNLNTVNEQDLKTINDYQTRLINLTSERDSLLQEKTEYQRALSVFEQGSPEEQIKYLMDEIKKAKTFAGITDVKGPGVEILVSFAKQEDFYDADTVLQKLINEIKASDAQAISINGERIISMSGIRLVGNYLAINNKHYGPPFNIKVIGNVKSLQSALNIPGGVLSDLKFYGAEVNISAKDELLITKIDESSINIGLLKEINNS